MRRRFAADRPLHERLESYVDVGSAAGPEGQPNSFLVAKLLAEKAIEASDRAGTYPVDLSPLLLYSRPAMLQASYAQALQEDGFAGRSAGAWKQAERLFEELSQREMAFHDNWRGRMADLPEWRAKEQELWKQFDEKCPRLRQRLFSEALRDQPPELKRAMRDQWQKDLWAPDLKDVERALRANDAAALALAREAESCRQKVLDIIRSRTIIQLDEWLVRCQIEQTSESIRARDLLYRARAARESGHLDRDNPENPGARQLYTEAFRLSSSSLREHPSWSENFSYWDDIVSEVKAARGSFGDDIVPPELTRLSQNWAP
jgi:hypothetical protein